ncbi:MAG: UvrD-helicase domain-containing protein [Planctomycetes bacterium]|nr:UvrD-helicase domain-containing protein [Planctomycetota bacterium]
MSADDLRQRDAAARHLARSEFVRPVVLEAGAGTGKTATLVARILVWALGPGWERGREALPEATFDRVAARVLDRITAITFTERAAVEMKQRVAEAIERLVRGAEVTGLPANELPEAARLGDRARALLVEIDRLHVETIHAFCRRVLADHALEAGLHPGFEVDADGEILDAELDLLLRGFLLAAYGDEADEDALRLLSLGVGPARIGAALRSILASDCPAARLRDDPYDVDTVAACAARLATGAAALLELIAAPLRAGKGNRKKALELIDALEDGLPDLRTAGRAEDLIAAVARIDLEGRAAKLADWARKGMNATETAAITDEMTRARAEGLARELQTELRGVASWNPELLRPAFRVLGRLAGELELRLRRRGALGFADLLREARDLLERHQEIRERLRQGMDQLLVDEVQDTDPIQYDIVRLLALEGEDRPGLFLVGDPKQSIYSFRNADLRAFEDFLGEVVAAGGLIAPLAVNFRSDPPILAEVERLIGPLMIHEAGLQPAFQKLLAAEKNLEGLGFRAAGRAAVEYWNAWSRDPAAAKSGPDTLADDARRIEAETIAADMLELHEREGVAYKDMALLLRATTQQETYLRALRDAGVPYLVERDRQFYRRREVIDLVSALTAVLDPQDQVALLGLLRSPVLGVPDAALLPLWRAGLPGLATRLVGADSAAVAEIDRVVAQAEGNLPAGLPELASLPRWADLLRYGLRALAYLREALESEPVDLFLDRFRTAFGFESQEAARFLGAHRAANLDRFFRVLLEGLRDGERSRRDLLRELVGGVDEGRDEAEGSPGDQTSDAVRIMSIHKAKGLDFDHVYVAALHQSIGGAADRGDGLRHDGGRFELRLFGAATPGLAALEERGREVSAAEALRTLYVAITRAAKRLVLAGRWPGDGADLRGVREARAMVDLVRWRSGRPAWEALTGADPDQAVATEDPDGVLWRLPDHRGRLAPRRELDRATESPEAAVAGLAELRARREAKRQTEARPLFLRASEAEGGPPAVSEDGDEEGDPAVALLARVEAGSAARFGTALHRALEAWPPERELAAWLRGQAKDPAALLTTAEAEEFGPAFAASLEGLAAGRLVARLQELADRGALLARELPVIAAQEDGIVTGAIDLLYQDGEEIVIADYKSDRIEGPVAAQAARHAEQGRRYLRALRASFAGEKKEVRFELWFLDADLVVAIEPA